MTHALVSNPPSEHHEETQPLLAKAVAPPRNPLPKFQLAIIYTIKLTLPIALTQVLPYFNTMIAKLAASEGADTGYYSGLASSIFHLSQFVSMFLWGRLSDVTGRIPVIVLGTSGTAVLTLLFGLSGSLSGVLVNRFLGGCFYGITGAIHSVVGELSDETNGSVAFPLYDIVSALGFAVGPLIGGTFESPAKQWPTVFSNPLWHRYPYLLPCLISSLLSFGAALLALFALQETLPSKRLQERTIVEDEEPQISPLASASNHAIIEVTESTTRPLSVRELLSIPVFRAVVASSAALGFAGSCFNSGFVLMAYSPLSQGGLALSPAQIGRALSGMGAGSVVLKLGMPALLRRYGTLGMFDFCMLVWPLTFVAMPLASWAARTSASLVPPVDGDVREGSVAEWISIAFVLFLSRLGCLAFSIIMILTRDHTPGSASLGTANGIAELAQSLAATVGPTVISSLFAVSASKHLLNGYLWVVFMVFESALGCWVANRIRIHRE